MKISVEKWGILFFLLFLSVFSENLLGAPQGIATLKEFSGEVMIKIAERWYQPEKELRLYSGSKIVTKQGRALLLFDDGATMSVDPFSSIRTMDQIRNSSSDLDKYVRLRTIRIMLGRAKYEEQPAKERNTRIELPMAVAALRGTGGWFGASETGESLGKLYDGAMETSGTFNEILPMVLELYNALNSTTWQASLASFTASDDAILNVKEIQAELESFSQNTDPDIRESVEATLSQINTVLNTIEDKIGKIDSAQKIKQQSDNQILKATKDTPQDVLERNMVSSQIAEVYIFAIKESMVGEIILILETLKGDPEGVASAIQSNAHNERVLAIAEGAIQTVERVNALTISDSSSNNKIIRSILQSASNTVKAAGSAVQNSSTGLLLATKDDLTATAQVQKLNDTGAKTLETAGKSLQMANKTIEALKVATTEQDISMALTLASSAEKSSASVMNALQVNEFAVESATEADQDRTASLTQAAERAAQEVSVADSAMDEVDNAFERGDADSMDNSSEKLDNALQDTKKEVDDNAAQAPGAPEAYEPPVSDEAPVMDEFIDMGDDFLNDEIFDDTRPVSPV